MGEHLDADIADLIQAIRLLVRRSRVAGAAEGLSWTEAAVLSRLNKDGPATTAELARAESMKPQSMGAKILALEQLNMVEREPHPEDGRQMIICLTTKGKKANENIQQAQRVWFAATVDKLKENDKKTLFAATKIIKIMSEPTV